MNKSESGFVQVNHQYIHGGQKLQTYANLQLQIHHHRVDDIFWAYQNFFSLGQQHWFPDTECLRVLGTVGLL